MNATMKASELIELSRRENRTVTEYPDTIGQQEELATDLLVECEGSSDVSGNGYSGPESNGFVEYWGDGWRVDVVNAE